MFASPVDIANRACQHVGARRIASLDDATLQAAEINFCYDKLRRAELRRSTWRFATRRVNIRPFAPTSVRFVPADYDSTETYGAGAIVQDSNGTYWISTIGSNTGNTPGGTVTGQPVYWQQYFGPVVASLWAEQTVSPYQAGELVYTAGPLFYINTANNQTDADPADGAPWVLMPGSPQGLTITLIEPAGPDMSVDGVARNMFPLPNGYLRPLAPDPKVASTSTLNTSGALRYTDYQMEGEYIISAQTTPILLRFIADISDVTAMDDLYCEGLAYRIGFEICERVTQSNIKLQAIAAGYQAFMRDARLINWLETASTEPQEEEYQLTQGPQGVLDSAAGAQQAGMRREG